MWNARAVSLIVLRWAGAVGLLFLAYRQVAGATNMGFGMAAAITVSRAVGLVTLAAVLACPELVAFVTLPATRLIGGLFYPERRFHRVPDDLLATLRGKINALQFTAAEQQLRRLLEGYGPDPQLYHLLALSHAARGEEPGPVLAEARTRLPHRHRPAFERLLAHEPAVRAAVVIERSDVPGQCQRNTETQPSAPLARLAWTPPAPPPEELPSGPAATPADARIAEPIVPLPKLQLKRR